MLCEIQTDIVNVINQNYKEDFSIVPRIDSRNISYSNFFENYVIKNKPCILTNICKSWPCRKTWVQNNSPNFSHLIECYNNLQITVSDCKIRNFNAHQTKCLIFSEYIKYWEDYSKSNYSNQKALLYLKDWHLKKITNDNFYNVPQFFSSDWLNEYFSEKTNDDYQFVYMGPSGTWTPFHADVFTSFSWSVNICGKKKWILFPPGEENYLRDKLGNLPYDVTKIDHQRKFYEMIQYPGEAVFVPSGWHHQVQNLEDTISINHNWINGCNIMNMWQSLIENLNSIKKEISDCKDMDGWLDHCQLMLKTSYGLDFQMFYDFIQYIANKRIQLLLKNISIKQFDTWVLGKNHAKFDLLKIKTVLELFINHSDFIELKITEHNLAPEELLLHLKEINV